MKKTLLLMMVALLATATFAQKVWNFGSDATNFPVNAGIGTGPFPVYIDGLGITGISTNANMGQVDASVKTFTSGGGTSYSFSNRFKFNGAGYTGAAATDATPLVNMPTQRYLTVNVSGNSTIYVIGVTGSSSSARKLFVTDGTNLVGSIDFPAATAYNDGTIQYSGPATTLYIFCNSSINLALLSVTNFVVAGVNTIFAEKGVTYNGREIENIKKLNLEIFDVIGKKVGSTNENFNMDNFPQGIYVVKAEGIKDSMKFTK
jgi:hypothetical protein